jgi:hypothetical protein
MASATWALSTCSTLSSATWAFLIGGVDETFAF